MKCHENNCFSGYPTSTVDFVLHTTAGAGTCGINAKFSSSIVFSSNTPAHYSKFMATSKNIKTILMTDGRSAEGGGGTKLLFFYFRISI